MSFGASQSVKNAQNSQSGITDVANQNSGTLNNLGSSALNTGQSNTNSGTNFFNTLLNGNQANTAALLSPTLNSDRAQSQATLQSTNTLTPRGGGRSGTLFNAAYQPNASIQNLFTQGRTAAASELPQIGLAQQGIGTNLYGLGNSALNTASGSNQASTNSALQVQQMSNQLAGGIGSLIGSLALAPLTGGGSLFGLLGGLGGGAGSGGGGGGGVDPSLLACWIASSIYGENDIRTHTLRAYLNGPFKRTRRGKLVMATYIAIGRQVAWVTRRSQWLRNLMHPMFESALGNCRSTFVEVC